jgi:hypothetical protein
MVFLAALALLLVIGTRPNGLRDRVSRPFVKTLAQEFGTRPAEVYPFLLPAALRYRSDPAVFCTSVALAYLAVLAKRGSHLTSAFVAVAASM